MLKPPRFWKIHYKYKILAYRQSFLFLRNYISDIRNFFVNNNLFQNLSVRTKFTNALFVTFVTYNSHQMQWHVSQDVLQLEKSKIRFLYIEADIWFRANDVSLFLQYKDAPTAITRKVHANHQKMYKILRPDAVGHPNELASKWIMP